MRGTEGLDEFEGCVVEKDDRVIGLSFGNTGKLE